MDLLFSAPAASKFRSLQQLDKFILTIFILIFKSSHSCLWFNNIYFDLEFKPSMNVEIFSWLSLTPTKAALLD